MKIILAAILLMFLSAVSQQTYADEDEVCVTVYPGDTIEDRFHMGQSSDNKSAIYCYIPKPTFDSCTKGNGDILYDPRSETVGDSPKILPDLQKEVDSGADILCVKIVHPYYNHQSWMKIPGWEEYKAVFPDASKRAYADSLMIKNSNNIIQFLKDNNGKLWSDTPHKDPPIITSIPAGLLPELADRDDVVKIDLWWKTFLIPDYIESGHESKLGNLLLEEIKHGKKNCIENLDRTFENCSSLDRNSNDMPVVNVGISTEKMTVQPNESLVDFLERNNQTVTDSGSWYAYADVAIDFLPELEARIDVMLISSANAFASVTDGSMPRPVEPEYDIRIESLQPAESPLQQIKDGVAAQDVHCRNDLILTILQDGRPVCLTEPTALIMAERILGSRA